MVCSVIFYLLRRSLKISLTEWMALMEALDKGWRGQPHWLYYLCRALLVKTEADFDRFDRAFLEYFKDVPFEQEVSQELLDWLDRPDALMGRYDEQQAELNELLSNTEIEEMFRERMNEQREQHNCGNYWVGTHGMSVFGNSGMSPNGIRVGARARASGPSGWRASAASGISGGTTPWTPASSRWPCAICGSSPAWWTCLPLSSMWTTPSRTPPTTPAP